MSRSKLPNVTPVPDAGLQGLTSPGVIIKGPRSGSLESAFTISGRFVLSQEEFERLGGSPHRDLVLTVLRDPMYGSYHPLKNCMFFHDDIEEVSGFRSGWFTLDVWEYSGFHYEGTYHIRVSLGEALSNVVETHVVSNTRADMA